MALEMTVTGPAVPSVTGDPGNEQGWTGGHNRNLLGRAAPAASLICWFYLSIVACLVVWVVIVRLLVGWSPLVITTGSMQPSINQGDIVLSANPEDGGVGLEEGAVITFADPVRPGERLTHRIDKVNRNGSYQTRGDANSVSDSYEVRPADVMGVGRLLVPAVGLPRVWVENGNLPLLALWSLGTLLALWAALRPTRRPRHG